MTVVDFPRDKPDAEHVVTDLDGRPMFRFAMSFTHEDALYGFDLFAYDAEDAERRALSVRQSAAVAGQIYRIVS